MRKFALTAVAAALLAPALIASASAQSVNIRVGDRGYHNGYRAYNQERVIVRSGHHCRMVTTKIHRPNGSVVIKKQRRCS